MSTVAASVSNIPQPPGEHIPQPILLPLAALLGDLQADAQARHIARLSGIPFGPTTSLPALDMLLGGAFTPGLHILHGSPGVGKTAFALQIAASCGCPAMFVTCEMGAVELLRRHTARITSTYLGKLKDGTLSGATVAGLAGQAIAAAPLLALLDATQAPAPPAVIAAHAATVRGSSDSEHFLLVVDSLHSWADAIGGGEEYDRLNAALVALRMLAKHLNCPILAISERNRAAMKSSGQSSGAGTRKIEYGAETVIALDLDGGEDVRPDASGYTDVTLKIGKNRNGSLGNPLYLRWHGATQRYTEA